MEISRRQLDFDLADGDLGVIVAEWAHKWELTPAEQTVALASLIQRVQRKGLKRAFKRNPISDEKREKVRAEWRLG